MSSSRSESGRRRGKSSRSGAKSRTPTAASSLPTELDELIAISREIGAQPDLVQGGGGNTSVKSRDGKRMFVKASGAALEDMSAERGWAELDRHLLDAIVNDT
ncbi:MAG TPA: class II aldolase/adducin family protein, partial [Planctomycetota bacterium]|nr:class II aldolase/adducin family protein [Planctomycetota bacterium]